MSVFGKLGVGGTDLAGKWRGGEFEVALDLATANDGTNVNTPNTEINGDPNSIANKVWSNAKTN